MTPPQAGRGSAAKTPGAAGLILAAGAGTRFGAEPKLLADVNGRPVLEHVVAAATAVLSPVVVVLGAHSAAIQLSVLFSDARTIVCDGWAEGQSASLQAGLAQLRHVDKVVVLLGDQPLVTPELIARFAAEPPGSRAAHEGRPGHPAVLGREEIAAAASASGDHGLRDLSWRLVEAGRPLNDIDTPEDLEAIRREARAIV